MGKPVDDRLDHVGGDGAGADHDLEPVDAVGRGVGPGQRAGGQIDGPAVGQVGQIERVGALALFAGVGVLVLRERLRRAQWVAVGLGAVAAVYLTVDYGAPPWISLGLALSFASYGLVKKHLGTSLSAIQSLTAETMVVSPAALGVLIYLILTGQDTFTTEGWTHALLLFGAGVATTVPLLWFAAAARRIPLSSVGLLQFLTPVLQLLCAVLVLGESMPSSRWVGFALVWVALVVLSADSVTTANRTRRRARAGVVPAP